MYGNEEKAKAFCDEFQEIICVSDATGDNPPVVYRFAKLLHSCITDKDEWKNVIDDEDFVEHTLGNTNKNSTDAEQAKFLIETSYTQRWCGTPNGIDRHL